jgi:very-short-patch-repair endonuclease
MGSIVASSPTRTLIDIAPLVGREALELALDDALRRGLTSLARMRWRLDEVGVRGRGGAARLRALVKERDPSLAPPESVLERRFLRFLRESQLPAPESQQVIRRDGAFIGRVDFAYPSQRVVIEVDGYQHHSGRLRWEGDLLRRNRLEAAGWRVLNVTSTQLETRGAEVAEMLRLLLDRNS